MSRSRTVSLFVTGECNLNCPHCSQAEFRRDHGDMTLETVDAVIARVATRHDQDEVWNVHITGGEPTLWPHLEEACARLRKSGLFRQIRIFTNCIAAKPLFACLKVGKADMVYTNRTNAHRRNLRTLIERWGQTTNAQDSSQGRVFAVGHENYRHKPLPDSPLEGVLPSDCNCDKSAVMGARVYVCGNVYANCARFHINMPAGASCALDEDWIAAKDAFGDTRFEMEACRVCLVNKKVMDIVNSDLEGEL